MSSHLIFVVDDEPFVRQLLEHHVTSSWGHVARTFADAESALAALEESPDLIIMDIGLPGIGGVEALRRVREADPDLPVIMLSAQESVDVAVTTWKLGAHDYLTKPPDLVRLEASIRAGLYTRSLAKEVLRLREAVTHSGHFANIVTHDGRMHDILAHVQRVSDSDIAVLIQGESGTGKELIARAVHFNGKRKDGPFVVVNCASIPRELLESEMFGHEKGAFTGAIGRKIGKFEQANMGTIFLDEIGEMDMSLQAKLLRVIQQREFDRVGGTATVRVDARIVSATNRDLQQAVREKLFREDLYYRISSFPVQLPPLRERRSDILLLAEHFLTEQAQRQGKTVTAFSRGALRLMFQYPWPGNIRELENAIERAVLLSETGTITEKDLPVSLQSFDTGGHESGDLAHLFDGTEAIIPFERLREEAIRHALKVTGGNILHAARQLGVGRATFYRLMKRYGIPSDR
jgi:two-component system, NtrC family, response regulator AtoC